MCLHSSSMARWSQSLSMLLDCGGVNPKYRARTDTQNPDFMAPLMICSSTFWSMGKASLGSSSIVAAIVAVIVAAIVAARSRYCSGDSVYCSQPSMEIWHFVICLVLLATRSVSSGRNLCTSCTSPQNARDNMSFTIPAACL